MSIGTAFVIGRSTVSTGKPGKHTPTGVFTVLQKKVRHESSIYKGAKMPHIQRLTWSGIALHAGYLPGYPASAGCVRMPVDFAAKLYLVTGIGTTVIIADHNSTPNHTVRPGLLFSGKAGPPPAGGFVWAPEKSTRGPVSIIVSAPDRRIYVYRNGVEIGRAPVTGLESARLSGYLCLLGRFDCRFQRPARLDLDCQRRKKSAKSQGSGKPYLNRFVLSAGCPCDDQSRDNLGHHRYTGQQPNPHWVRVQYTHGRRQIKFRITPTCSANLSSNLMKSLTISLLITISAFCASGANVPPVTVAVY